MTSSAQPLLARAPRLLLGLVLALPSWASHLQYHVHPRDTGAWPAVLSSLGLQPGPADSATVHVVGPDAPVAAWRDRIAAGAMVITEGRSPLAESFGITAALGSVTVRQTRDVHAPDLPILWEKPILVPRVQVASGVQRFARERWEDVPLLAGVRHGKGALLWLAASPGPRGYERFPYLPQALRDLGLQSPVESRRLWAFFDGSYRLRADPEHLARRWRQAGIAALQVAAWHHNEPDPQKDEFLRRLIDACHRHAIQVYAWLELPHVSEEFWNRHPEWREKTALGQDAHLDWRKLMNLADPDCARAVAADMHRLLDRFDWDGVNLAELYFESLEGHGNAARFTPMNAAVRREFASRQGFDPALLFDASSPRHWTRDAPSLAAWLEYRASLAARLQRDWLAEIDLARRRKPHLDVALTHIDDRYDTRMRDLLGADSARVLPLQAGREFTFLVEDPATMWHLGPERYSLLAERYRPATPRPAKLAIDINIVERYQDVYPTKQQTGAELLRLVHVAARAFPRVALYFEASVRPVDQPFLASASAIVESLERREEALWVESKYGVGVRWEGPARLDGRPWPVSNGQTVWVPPGRHRVESDAAAPPLRLLDLNADLVHASAGRDSLQFAYRSDARAIAVLEAPPSWVEIDGEATAVPTLTSRDHAVLLLPPGQHVVQVGRAARPVGAQWGHGSLPAEAVLHPDTSAHGQR